MADGVVIADLRAVIRQAASDAEGYFLALRQSVACLYGSLQHRNRRYVVLLFERLDALFIKL